MNRIVKLYTIIIWFVTSAFIKQDVTYPTKQPETTMSELIATFYSFVATVKENYLLVLIVVVLYIGWRTRKARKHC